MVKIVFPSHISHYLTLSAKARPECLDWQISCILHFDLRTDLVVHIIPIIFLYLLVIRVISIFLLKFPCNLYEVRKVDSVEVLFECLQMIVSNIDIVHPVVINLPFLMLVAEALNTY